VLLIVGHHDTETRCLYRVAHTPTECRMTEVIPERTPDGHPQVWLLYRPEPFEFNDDEDRSIHNWIRRCDIFTSRAEAIAFLDNIMGRQIAWRLYGDPFPELWIAQDGISRWLMVAAPVNPPGRGR
jgi:hypothetical protein